MTAARTSVRGKCRYCVTSVRQAAYGWAGEADGDARPYECPAAPRVPCEPCAGLGRLEDVSVPVGQPGRWTRCLECGGVGEVPGPHWPWRHPAPR